MALSIIWESLPRLLGGTVLTIQITALSLVIGLAFAVPFALMRLSRNPLIRLPVYGYIFYFRGTAMSLSLLKFVGQASLVDDAMLPS